VEQRLRAEHLISLARRQLEDETIRFFRPNPAQQLYIDAVGKPEGFIVVFAAANGIGKTACTAALLAAIIWPELAPRSVFGSWIYQNWPYPKDFRIVSTPQQIAEGGSIQREIQKWFPKGQYTGHKNGKPYTSQFLAKDFTINLMSFDMDVQAFEGATNGCVVFDEPPPKAIFNACAARMRKGGRLLFPGTPLMDAAWIMDDLVSKADGEYIQLVRGDIEMNCEEHAQGGMLKHSDIERMIKNYDPDELEARAKGQFMHLSGRILKGFDRVVHVAKEPIQPKKDGWLHIQVNDPAIGKPLALLWAQADAGGYIEIYDESPNFPFEGAKDSNLSVSDYVLHFKAKEEGRAIGLRILDRHFGNARRTLGGKTLKEEFRETGEQMGYPVEYVDSYHVGDATSEVETGILKIKEVLRYDKTKDLDTLNRPKILISPTCTNTIMALERWGRDPKSFKPKEEWKDFADLVRMLVMAEPKYEPPSEPMGINPRYYGVG
jgi:hypothetical protein